MFSKTFLWIKYVVVIVSFILVILYPKTLPYLLAINILVAVAESARKRDAIGVILGVLLVLWSLTLKYNDHRIIAFLIIYTIWNTWFYYSGYKNLSIAAAQVVIPAVIALLALQKEPDLALWYFAVLRLLILFSILTHTLLL